MTFIPFQEPGDKEEYCKIKDVNEALKIENIVLVRRVMSNFFSISVTDIDEEYIKEYFHQLQEKICNS